MEFCECFILLQLIMYLTVYSKVEINVPYEVGFCRASMTGFVLIVIPGMFICTSYC